MSAQHSTHEPAVVDPQAARLADITRHAIEREPEIARLLDRLERTGNVRDVMAQLDAHEYRFSWSPHRGTMTWGCGRVDMRDDDWLTPMAARIVVEHWGQRIKDHLMQRAAEYDAEHGALPEEQSYTLRYFFPVADDDEDGD